MISEIKRKENEFRKEIILKAAEQVFGKKPYEEVSVLEISRKSGVCIQSIYNLFGSKKELYKNMVFFRVSKFKKALDEALKEKKDPLTLLK
ncbi:MAG: TetR/AcrR family transcriptional regulator, partial [Thermoanaerobaculaceae bacterium]|nr:TetR/AcrR family transcriptional regulator [Thermoanaerobaculaceae bacterium]